MSSATAQQRTGGKASVELVKTDGSLVTEEGTTSIADTVVRKISGLAAREVSGVHALGGGAARAFSALRERIPGASASASQGVAVEVGAKQAAVDLEIVVEYGVSIAAVTKAVRHNVITSIERLTGLAVVEVNINVNDLHLPTNNTADTHNTPPTRPQ